MSNKYEMKISRLTVDKLGVKLYDRVSAVIAEIVANCYDADATEVDVVAPMGEFLASKSGGKAQDKGYVIEVRDNGVGMTPDQVNAFYLKVGAERRKDYKRGDTSKVYKRKVMGRKGVGKLAPFGVCQKVEVLSSGDEKVDGIDEHGAIKKGYLTAHLVLDRSVILSDTDETYKPKAGPLDGIVRVNHGTAIKMAHFDHRRVPTMDEFERQLSQRFGLESPKWRITLIDSLKATSDPNYSRRVGSFLVERMPNTTISFETCAKGINELGYWTLGPDNLPLDDLKPGFEYEDKFYPVTGWVAYSKVPYKDDLMAGIRIYCRGKIAAQTHVFNLKAGFTGEYDIRSYLVGELHADWLDEAEDLIRTDRQDILWSNELGQALQNWGQILVKKIGVITRQPQRKKAWQYFEEVSKIEEKVLKAFPSDGQKEIRENTLKLAKVVAQSTRQDEFDNHEVVQSIVDLSILLGPHITLDEKLREAAESQDNPLSAITGILKTARIAELSSFGRIAEDRIKVIKKVEELKDDPETLESALQSLIEEAPWLINPQWSPIIANQTFSTLVGEFRKFYKKQTGNELTLGPIKDPKKRADFVLSSQDNAIQIVEIKQPDYDFKNEDMVRINSYVEIMESFLADPANGEFHKLFPDFHVTLVCDGASLSGVHKRAFDELKKSKRLTHINWKTFLLRTRQMHQGFLEEAERQQKAAARDF